MWEEILKDKAGGNNIISSRLKVPGGWVVRAVVTATNGTGVSLVFVADADNTWKLDDSSVSKAA